MDPYDREEQALCDAYNSGDMTLSEYNQAMRELQADYREAAREAAQEAYDRELDRW